MDAQVDEDAGSQVLIAYRWNACNNTISLSLLEALDDEHAAEEWQEDAVEVPGAPVQSV